MQLFEVAIVNMQEHCEAILVEPYALLAKDAEAAKLKALVAQNIVLVNVDMNYVEVIVVPFG